MVETALNFGYLGLFVFSFVAATLIAAPSDVLAMGMPAAGYHPVWVALVATAGGYGGNLVNYAVGRYGTVFIRKHLLENDPQDDTSSQDDDSQQEEEKDRWQQRAEKLYRRYGVYSLLLSGVPFVGDPLTTVAGGFRVNLLAFTVMVWVGKLVKFALLLGLVDLFGWGGS